MESVVWGVTRFSVSYLGFGEGRLLSFFLTKGGYISFLCVSVTPLLFAGQSF